MNSKEEKFFDLPTILALIGLIIALPALLIGIFFNKKFDITDKILLVLSALPTIIYGLFYLCIFNLITSFSSMSQTHKHFTTYFPDTLVYNIKLLNQNMQLFLIIFLC